jgi:hypothetical protein
MKLEVLITTKVRPLTEPRPPLWMHLEDGQLSDMNYTIRECAPCPAVFTIFDDPHTFYDKQWQFYVRAINYGMTIPAVSALYAGNRAFFNNTGIPPHHNWLTGENADFHDPNADKVRTCARNVVTGVEVFKIRQVVSEVIRTRSVNNLLAPNMLQVTTFDSRLPPPLKAGRTYPNPVDQINLDDYAITPQTHRWMFLVANIIGKNGSIFPFGGGAVYPWTGESAPFSFLPHLSNHGYGEVLYPLFHFARVAAGSPIPSPYRFL